MIRKSGVRVAATSMLVAGMMATGAVLPGGEAYALNKPIVDNPDGDLLATEFYSMLPFVIPIIDGEVHERQLTLVLAIGLFDDGDRDELRRVSPRFRDAIYRVLFRLISFRTAKPRISPRNYLERKLYPVVKILGGDMVKSLKVHKLILGRRP